MPDKTSMLQRMHSIFTLTVNLECDRVVSTVDAFKRYTSQYLHQHDQDIFPLKCLVVSGQAIPS